MNSLTLSIAGFRIRLESDGPGPIRLEPGYLPFLVPDEPESSDMVVTVKKGIPKPFPASDRILFEARDDRQNYYSVHKQGDILGLQVYSQRFAGRIQQTALLDLPKKKWLVHYAGDHNDTSVFPLQYPLGPLLFYYLTLTFDALLIHASGIHDGRAGRLFTGFSGSGKSTMAGLWRQSGSRIINDDRLIIRRESERYVMYNTPMQYVALPEHGTLDAIHLIRHAPENSLVPLTGARAVAAIMANCIQQGYEKEHIHRRIDFLTGITARLPVYDTGFIPDPEIVGYILEKEKKQPEKSL
ncbi:MAG: hypothetical protein EOM90_08535 [Alphaproteobacteria bacterium]|nr:hypothetical protein [Alphaproteobacteria bacterium]